MENAVKNVRDVADYDEREGFSENEMLAILRVVQPIEKTVTGGESVIARQSIQFLLSSLLGCLRCFAEVASSVVNVGLLLPFRPIMNVVGDCPKKDEIRNFRKCHYSLEAPGFCQWEPSRGTRFIGARGNLAQQAVNPNVRLNIEIKEISDVAYCGVSEFSPNLFPRQPERGLGDASDSSGHLRTFSIEPESITRTKGPGKSGETEGRFPKASKISGGPEYTRRRRVRQAP
jgi:hypothetical protein